MTPDRLSGTESLSEHQYNRFMQKQSFPEHVYLHLFSQIMQWTGEEKSENTEHARERYKDNPGFVDFLERFLFRKNISTRRYDSLLKERRGKDV